MLDAYPNHTHTRKKAHTVGDNHASLQGVEPGTRAKTDANGPLMDVQKETDAVPRACMNNEGLADGHLITPRSLTVAIVEAGLPQRATSERIKRLAGGAHWEHGLGQANVALEHMREAIALALRRSPKMKRPRHVRRAVLVL